MKLPYRYEFDVDKTLLSKEAIIILPDIYGITDYSIRTAEEFLSHFVKPVFILDYFYPITGELTSLHQDEGKKAFELMGQVTGEGFREFFQKAISEIAREYPHVTEFIVVGFCFGGRLALIAGGEKSVCKVVSFYGGGPHTADFIENKTPVEYLISKRAKSQLKVCSFFGTQDESIPISDRERLSTMLKKAEIFYEPREYEAGHAYFQAGRKSFNVSASEASWNELKQILK